MSSTPTTDAVSLTPVSMPAVKASPEVDIGRPAGAAWTFFEWSLAREVFLKRTNLLMLAPLIVAAIVFEVTLRLQWVPGTGRMMFRELAWVCAFSIFALAIRHVSRAVCWELSVELRELVRLTGIGPLTLLGTRSVSRVLTIALSLVLMSPLLAYTRALGQIGVDRWIAAGWGLLLVAALTVSFALIASVSSSSAKNADTTAANVTFGLIAAYHALFWILGAIFWFLRFSFPLGSTVSEFCVELAPIRQVYRSLAAPELFEPLKLTYWIHFVTATVGMWMATRVMQNRFHSEEFEPDRSTLGVTDASGVFTQAPRRPRCSERPFLWKDTYILGGSALSQNMWIFISVVAMIGVLLAIASDITRGSLASVVLGIWLTIAAPWVVALQFDALMAAEFREKTWGSLMLLPVNLLDPIVAKIEAALWARKWIFPPILVCVAFAASRYPFPILIAVTIAVLMFPILVEISVLSHFNARKWWAGLIVALLVLLLIAAVVAVWIIFPQLASLIVTIVILSITIVGFLMHIQWRLQNWTGD